MKRLFLLLTAFLAIGMMSFTSPDISSEKNIEIGGFECKTFNADAEFISLLESQTMSCTYALPVAGGVISRTISFYNGFWHLSDSYLTSYTGVFSTEIQIVDSTTGQLLYNHCQDR